MTERWQRDDTNSWEEIIKADPKVHLNSTRVTMTGNWCNSDHRGDSVNRRGLQSVAVRVMAWLPVMRKMVTVAMLICMILQTFPLVTAYNLGCFTVVVFVGSVECGIMTSLKKVAWNCILLIARWGLIPRGKAPWDIYWQDFDEWTHCLCCQQCFRR